MIAIILRSFILESNLVSFSGFKSELLDMSDPIKISLAVKDFNLPTLRIDAWVTEAIKESKLAKQVLNKNNYLLSRSRIKSLIETKNIDFDGVIIEDPSFKIKSGKIITVSLPEIENAIPKIELPKATLQQQMTKMMSSLDNPGAFLSEFEDIKKNFGGSIDIDKMVKEAGIDPNVLNSFANKASASTKQAISTPGLNTFPSVVSAYILVSVLLADIL